jgi:NAD-dependent SIR2 family protein deacetylase
MKVIDLKCVTCHARTTISEDDQRNREQGFYPTCALCGSPLIAIKARGK